MAQETAIAYGIEFYVGRRSRDKAISGVRAAGELVNQASIQAFRKGAKQRQEAHDDAVGKLRKKSKAAIKALSDARMAASKEAAKGIEDIKPSVAKREAELGRKLSTAEIKEFGNQFGATIRAMDNSMQGFVERSKGMGVDLGDAADTAGVMQKFGEADVQDRTKMIADLENETKKRDKITQGKKKEQIIATANRKEAEKEQARLKKELKYHRDILKENKKTSVAWKKSNKLVNKMAKEQTVNNKKLKEYVSEQKRLEKQIKENQRLGKADKELLRELNTLQKKLTAEERKHGKIQREIGNEERKLDRELKESDKQEIYRLKEKNRLQTEYSRHIDDAAQKIGGTLKNAFVIGTAAIAALNYKLMAVSQTFMDFEKQLINANSIWQESNETLFEVSDSVVEFGTRYGVEMQNATSGLYQYASAGVSAAEAMQMLQHTLKLSMAVQGDHNTLSKLTTQTILGFSMEFSEAEQVTDKFAHAINKSLIEWDDLASSIKFALPFFISTGQSLDQLLGGLQVLTNRALEAGIAGRGLRQALAEFTQHADDNTAAFRKLGIEIMDLEGNMKPLNVIAEDFNRTMGEGATDMEVMIALMEDLNVRGATAFVHLAQNADEFTAAVDDLANSAGSATAMADIQQTSLANQIQVVKNALMAPFILSDEIGEQAGYLNMFAMELHGIVDIVETLFIKKMSDGSIEITKMGEIIRDFVIGALHQAKDVIILLVGIIKEFTENGNAMTGMLSAFTIPLKLVLKLMDAFGDGFLEAVVLYKIMNGLLPINSMLLAKNYQTLMLQMKATVSTISWKGKDITLTQAQVKLAKMEIALAATKDKGWKTRRRNEIDAIKVKMGGVKANSRLGNSLRGLAKSQAAQQGAMMIMMFATQKLGKNSIGAAAAIGALAGAFMGLSFAMNLAAAAEGEMMFLGLKGGTGYAAAIGAGAVAGAMFNMMMQQMMKPPDLELPEELTMDMGGRFLKSRNYDMGGRYSQEHGMAILKDGETVIPKTGNILGQGITLNMGDVHVQDGEDFAERVAMALPAALRRADETGGV